MTNNNHILNVVESWEADLKSRRLAARSHPNSTNKGNSIELCLEEVLLKYLPTIFNVGKGFVRSPNETTNSNSPEIDLIIHRSDFPRIMIDQECSNYVPESILAGIEVKTNLTKEHIKRAVEVACHIKCVDRHVVTEPFALMEQIKYFIFATESDAKIENIAVWIKDAVDEFTEKNRNYNEYFVQSAIDGIFILDKGSIHLPVRPWLYWHEELSISNPGAQYAILSMEKYNLGMLLALLMPDRHLMPQKLNSIAQENHQRFYIKEQKS